MTITTLPSSSFPVEQAARVMADLIKLRNTPLPVQRLRHKQLDEAIYLLSEVAESYCPPVDTLTLPLFSADHM